MSTIQMETFPTGYICGRCEDEGRYGGATVQAHVEYGTSRYSNEDWQHLHLAHCEHGHAIPLYIAIELFEEYIGD